MLEFPETGADLSDGFNSAISQDVLSINPKSAEFFGGYELVASDLGEDGIVADWFMHKNTQKILQVPRKETG